MNPYYQSDRCSIYNCDVLQGIPLPDESVQCVVTSPPYWGLRDYGVDGQLGLEKTPQEFIANMVAVFREVKRVLRNDGTCWVNLGDTYANSTAAGDKVFGNSEFNANRPSRTNTKTASKTIPPGLKPKDLCGIPWRVALALQEDGWWLRSDIIWCLSGGTQVYARTQKGDMPMTVRDVARLDPTTVQLWNGEKWTQLLGTSKSNRCSDEIEIVLRSGERISCTPTHKFPTSRGLLQASELAIGDTLQRVQLPEPENQRDCEHIGIDAAWLAGLYVAEGSRTDDTIQIAGHAKETQRWNRIQRIAESYGGYATRTIDGNKMDIRLYGKMLNAVIDTLVSGNGAKQKAFNPVVYRYSNAFLAELLYGYLQGDGHWDSDNNRWRLGFTRNYNLERDLRTICARLGYKLILNMSSVPYNGASCPTFRGEIRTSISDHWNCKDTADIVEIRKARCRQVYDLGVADEPHVFALASGILTHNSKPNPMPESVTDRPTKAHEYIFLLTKSAKYYYDVDAIREPLSESTLKEIAEGYKGKSRKNYADSQAQDASATKLRIIEGKRKQYEESMSGGGSNIRGHNGTFNAAGEPIVNMAGRNKRTVWTIHTHAFPEAHFATYPPKLVEPCVLAGTKEGDIVLDPFSGSGTTGEVAMKLGRNYVGCELNPEYIDISLKRLRKVIQQPQLQMSA
jgi:DNA modification methylase